MNTPNQLIEAAKSALNTMRYTRKRMEDVLHTAEIDCAIDLLAAAIEASTQDGWQDISSAPKGREFIGLTEADEIGICEWREDEQGWSCGFADEVVFSTELTHWREKPNPPTAQPDEQAISDDEWRSDEEAQALIDAIHDEQVCSTCGGDEEIVHPPTADDIRAGESRRFHEPCPDCQPVPPSEGEIECGYCGTASHTSEEHVAAPSEGEVAAGKLDENFAQTILTIANLIGQGRTDALAGFNAEYLRDNVARLLETLATNTPPNESDEWNVRKVDNGIAIYCNHRFVGTAEDSLAPPGGHVAVVLPVEVSERAAKDWRDCSDETIDADEAVIEAACRTALEVE